MDLSRPKFLAFARSLAMVASTAAPTLVACAGTPPPVNTVSPPASSAAATTTSDPPAEPVAGAPCRCSWDTNADAAPRVCKKGETNYEGDRCIPGSHPSYGEGGMPPMKGPLPPPDLPLRS